MFLNGAELLTQTTEIMGGNEPNNTLFYQLVNMFARIIEGMRPWVKLRKVDSSVTITSSNTIDTAKDLPSDFRKPYNMKMPNGSKGSLFLKGSGGDYIHLELKPLTQRELYRNMNGYWFFDTRLLKFYVSGTFTGTYTVYLSYIHNPTAIAAGTEWVLGGDQEQDTILSMLVAEAIKSGIDYDEINARQATANNKVAQAGINQMIFDDDAMVRAELGV